jgi:signal transduction histidine kinase
MSPTEELRSTIIEGRGSTRDMLMQRCRRLSLFLLLAFPLSVAAQQYQFESYGQAQGLDNLNIVDLALEKQGFLWVATGNGVFRFDGSRFEHFGPDQGLTEQRILEVDVDSFGRVWVVDPTFLSLRTGDHFSPIARLGMIANGGRRLLPLSHDQILVTDDGRLRKLTLKSSGARLKTVDVFTEDERKTHPELIAISNIAQAADGTIWMGCGMKVCSLDKGQLQIWGTERGLKPGRWQGLYIDRRGSVWVATATRVSELKKNATSFVDHSPPQIDQRGLLFQWNPILEDRQGRILVRTIEGIARWDGASWEFIGPLNGLKGGRVTSLSCDANGDLWIGHGGFGLTRWIGYEHWESWTEVQGLPSSGIWSTTATKSNEVLIGTIKGPAVLESAKRQIRVLGGGRPWPFGQVGGIVEDQERKIWAATFRGSVVRIDPKSGEAKPFFELSRFTRGLFVSPDARIWVLTDRGVDVIDSTKSPRLRHVGEIDSLLGDDLRVVSATSSGGNDQKDGNLWFLSEFALLRYRSGLWSKLALEPLARARLKEVCSAPDGTLWLAGEDETGLSVIWHLKPANSTMKAVSLPIPDELKHSSIYSIIVDRGGRLWLGTDRGVAGWNGYVWKIFTLETGLIWNDTNRGVISEGSDGSIWIGTSEGLAHLMHPEGAFASVRLGTVITSVEHGSEDYAPGNTPALPWSTDTIRFHFASPNERDRSALSYSYRLFPLNSSWITTKNPDATFSNLPPGGYRFQVFSKNSNLGSTSEIVESPLTIVAPWWRTAWFYTLCVLCGILMLWALYTLRMRHMKRRRRELEELVIQMEIETTRLAKRDQDAALAEERNRMAMEMHDTLAGAFTGIFMQLQLASDLSDGESERRLACVEHAEELARTGLRQVREFVHTLTISEGQHPFFEDAMRGLVSSVPGPSATACSFSIKGVQKPLRATYGHALLRITQEALGNAQRYAKAKHIAVTLMFEEATVRLKVTDDGVGFIVDQPRVVGFGIAGMKARVARLGGLFEMESAPGGGTQVCIEFSHPYEEEDRHP